MFLKISLIESPNVSSNFEKFQSISSSLKYYILLTFIPQNNSYSGSYTATLTLVPNWGHIFGFHLELKEQKRTF